MTVAAVMLVKDEMDILPDVVRHTAGQVDMVIVADNNSTDGTYEYLEGAVAQGLVYRLVKDPEVGYYQSRKMSSLAHLACELGADWVVPIDADEVWAARSGRLGDSLDSMPAEIMTAQAVLFDHVVSSKDPTHKGPLAGIGWRQALPLPLRKVACRCGAGLTIWQGNHGVSYPSRQWVPAVLDELVVRHFPYRSVHQFVTKVRNGAAAYAAPDLPADAGAHKREFAKVLEDQGDAGLALLFRKQFFSQDPVAQGLVFDPCAR